MMIGISQWDLKTQLPTLKWSVPQDVQPSTWVKLLERPTAFSFNEALLLCQCSEEEWLAWVPDHGEVMLRRHQFCTAIEN